MAGTLLSTLGRLRLTREGQELLAGRRMELLLLAYLADRSPRAVPRAELAALLWGERDERRARHSLRQALFKLRRGLGDDLLEVTRDSARVREGALALDIREMEAALDEGRTEAATGWWRGDFLPGAEDVGTEPLQVWVEAERERLRRRYRWALEQLTEEARRGGDWDAAVHWARRWSEAAPLEEPPAARLIESLRLAQRHDEAAATHAAFTARLRNTLEKDPSPGFQRLDEVGPAGPAAANAPDPVQSHSSSSAVFTPDLVGRTEAFAELTAAWEAVRNPAGSGEGTPVAAGEAAGTGTVVLVEGGTGAGKTRLCEEFLRWLGMSDPDALVLRSRALRLEHGRPRATARHLFAGLDRAPGLGGSPDETLAAVSRLVPPVRERFPRLPTAPANVAVDEALRRVLADVAAEVPVIVFLDDLPVADPQTVEVLISLAGRLPAGVLLLLTGRDDAPGAHQALQPFRAIPDVRRLVLTPLTAPDIEALLASMMVLDAQDRHALAGRLHAAAAGNPFYTISLLSALADAGGVSLDDQGVWRVAPALEGDPLPLPSDLRDAIRLRLDQLDSDARHTLDAAAVLRRPIEPGLLESVVELPSDRLATAVETLLSRRLLRALPPPGAAYEFAHDLIGRIAYHLLSPPRRRSLHAAAFEALRATQGEDEEERAAIRYHRERAGRRAISGRWRRSVAVAAGLLVLVAVVALAWNPAFTGETATAPPDGAARVAVLYLEDLTGDASDAYLAAGLTEAIASRLGHLERLRVKSPRASRRFRGDGSGLDPVAIGDSLGVDYLVDGSVRRGEDRLRVSVRLTNTTDGFQVWNETYDVPDERLLDVQDTITTRIATHIAGRLIPDEQRILGRRATHDPRAYDHFLRGNYHLARRTPASVRRAIDAYREAARLDPDFSAALAREAYGYALFLDWGWSFPGVPQEELLARGLLLTERVLQRDSASADAWMSRGYLFVLRDPVRHAGAAEAFRRSIQLDGSNAEVHHQLGQTLMVLGHMDEARAAYRRAVALEPGRAMTFVPLAAIRMRQGDRPGARRLMDSALIADPSVPYARASSGLQRLELGDAEGARSDAETALQLDRSYALPARSVLAGALHRLGDTAAALEELERARSALADPQGPSPTEMYYLGAALVVMERHDEALALIERTRPRSAWVWFYLQGSVFDPVRQDPRFRVVVDPITPPGDLPG